jgi:NADH-quinone oxidoreductase subunit L
VSPLVLLALACLMLTPLAFPPLRDSVERVLAYTGQPAPHTWEFALSGGLALLAGAVTWSWGTRPLPLPERVKSGFADWLLLERAAHLLLVAPVMRLARAAATFDDRGLDRAVDGTAAAAVSFAHWTNDVVERAIDGAVTAVATGTRALGRLARRPQTGQLHQYLAQAVAAFTVLAVVLVLVR